MKNETSVNKIIDNTSENEIQSTNLLFNGIKCVKRETVRLIIILFD